MRTRAQKISVCEALQALAAEEARRVRRERRGLIIKKRVSLPAVRRLDREAESLADCLDDLAGRRMALEMGHG